MNITTDQAVKVGLIFKMIYRFFLKKKMNEAVKNSKNTIDDKGLAMVEDFFLGE